MGRQTQVAMTDGDERDFLAFLRGTADIQLFESSASYNQKLWMKA
jgi:hypothetical protein